MDKYQTSFSESIRLWRVWLWLSRQDIKSKYRGSILGPFWLVLNLTLLISFLSYVYSQVFNVESEKYIPYLASGFIAWWYISNTLNDFCFTYTSASSLVRNYNFPLGVHVLRTLAKNIFLMFHNVIVYVAILFIYPVHLKYTSFYVIPGFVLDSIILFELGLILSLLSARFRDLPHIISNITSVVMFITPIMFYRDSLVRKSVLVDNNLFFHMIEVIRAPMLGQRIVLNSWEYLIFTGIIFFVLSYFLMKRYGSRVAYWV